MENNNNTNPTIERTQTYNLELITKSLSFVNNTAKNHLTKSELVQDTYFDYLANKQNVKTLMVELGVIEPKNKEVATFYFKNILNDLSQKAFKDFNIEIKEVIKEEKEFNYSFKNVDKTKSNENFVIAFKELFKLYKTLIQLISTNNLSLRIKLFDYKMIKSILDSLTLEIDLNGSKTTVKSAINAISKDSNDIQYIETIKAYLKQAKELPIDNIEPLIKSFNKLSIEAKIQLLAKLNEEFKASKSETKEESKEEDNQSPSSEVFTLED